jgi:hypothetical protein
MEKCATENLNMVNQSESTSTIHLCESTSLFSPCTDYTLFGLAIAKSLSLNQTLNARKAVIAE